MAGIWTRRGIGNASTVASGNITLSTTNLNAVAGDLVVACIAYRSNAAFTLPSGWNLVNQQSSGNNSGTSGRIASGLMAWIEWTSPAPDLTFLRTGGDVAMGCLLAFTGQALASPFDEGGGNTLASESTTVTTAGVTVAEPGSLLVSMVAGAAFQTVSNFRCATSPTTGSGSTNTASRMRMDEWFELVDTGSATGGDVGLAIGTALKSAAGSTGEFRATDAFSSRHVMIAGVFKPEPVSEIRISKLSRYTILR